MLSLPDANAIRAALREPLDPKLHTILAAKLASVEANGLENLTHVVVVQAGTTEEELQQELGWSPLQNPIDGVRYGEAEFVPYWSFLQDLGGVYELIQPVGNSGFAYIVVIEDREGVPAELLRMCRQYAGRAG
ncbi:hypothetical protein G7A66_07230 [Altererythrobacter sp. SALINAS58]|uniref:hypothetical protein n=1 Tax=Alteripontixanthobacter muriae TaxID=2705546 RepID=UPI001575EC19|nr:hypothetical protein [Alteripontixanthobacter muriae]NTZ42882.1 hypothetical protein [Alteripontixanthobacter muriae]